MRLTDYLSDQLIYLDIEANTKEEAISKTVMLMEGHHLVKDGSKFLSEIFQREQLGSTAIGKGIALPHARTQIVKQIILAMTRLKKGVDFGAEDKEPVRLLFLLGTPLNSVGEYLKVLARLSKIIKLEKIRSRLLKAESIQAVYEIIDEAEDQLKS